ncbi:MAG: methylmalonyl-CoA mutase [Planctomycetes bacterium]|nr:methylmalonyl-CoA mutase [Planctomycetota bacterium]MDP6423548.1 methylmalonyl-CoA mutase family protein [Planctomycetota bacterium]
MTSQLESSGIGSEGAVRNKVRIVSATALFDGHDASINIMRRILQASGAEVIHLGHNRSAQEVVDAAVQEDVQGIAITSYQGGHNEYFKYVHDLLVEAGCEHVQIFGGGGGVILPEEMAELHAYGVARIYSPDDGRRLGLQGMIDDMLGLCDFPTGKLDGLGVSDLTVANHVAIGRLISAAENGVDGAETLLVEARTRAAESEAQVLGVTGTGGSGKSSFVDEMVRRFTADYAERSIAVISVDPSRRKSGGALLGDRIRMNAILPPRVYMRSLATRRANLSLSPHIADAVAITKAAGFDLIVLETSGIGQSDTEIVDHCDLSLYVMTPEFGAPTQLEKIDMLDFADAVVINKFDKRGADDALREVRKQYSRNRKLFDMVPEDLPVFGSIASQFNDPGTNRAYAGIMGLLGRQGADGRATGDSEKHWVVPPERVRYLAEIAESNRGYDTWVDEQVDVAQRLQAVEGAMAEVEARSAAVPEAIAEAREELRGRLDPANAELLASWADLVASYRCEEAVYEVRGREIRVQQFTESLAHTMVPKVSMPRYSSDGDRLRWLLQENVPGEFPYTAGVFSFKRTGEDPTRMFAGEGGPEATNRRFHYVSKDMPAKRLSTAFDSVTLYGEDPDHRPDIYGKVGNAGVSIATVDDAKKLYSGFDLCDPRTSVSMTINGPAPMLLGFFLNAAIDQQCELWIREQGLVEETQQKIATVFAARGQEPPCYDGEIPPGNDGLGLLLLGVSGDEVLPADTYAEVRARALSSVRGTVQADILKEDQAQNTCIFSTEFALRLMGDIQGYFIANEVRNFYSVSISGYHIAEAGANPITQLAFTLANGFTYVEYYLARGMDIDEFGPNLSFFFSNGIDPEYAVIGRVARRIWAKAMKIKYGASQRAQKLKYHIQTSGRSLHAQEIQFNDIRTTLQALYAIYDNCQSLHTNAYDEAITTPTEESVRRAIAIQLIINRELGLAKNENPLQGSFIVDELTDLVEEAVLCEFERIAERGGVLGAMETMYQRSKIQEESLYYETLKESAALPIVGVNTFLSSEGSPFVTPKEVRRSTDDEKELQIRSVRAFQQRNVERGAQALVELKETAVSGDNLFAVLMQATKCCSLGQISGALYEVGGQYRRSM